MRMCSSFQCLCTQQIKLAIKLLVDLLLCIYMSIMTLTHSAFSDVQSDNFSSIMKPLNKTYTVYVYRSRDIRTAAIKYF